MFQRRIPSILGTLNRTYSTTARTTTTAAPSFSNFAPSRSMATYATARFRTRQLSNSPIAANKKSDDGAHGSDCECCHGDPTKVKKQQEDQQEKKVHTLPPDFDYNEAKRLNLWTQPDDFQRIFANNKKWVQENLSKDPEYFKKLAKGQTPKYLFIGCSDSRVNANEILGLGAGELFVHRNIANLCVNSDLNFLAVLQFAVEFLKVQDIIVCGHYGCGGVEAAMNPNDMGLLEHWLRNIRDIHRVYFPELSQIEDRTQRLRRMVELNVTEQCINLFKNSIVQKRQALTGYPRIHGFVYDISEGIMRELEVDNLKEIIRQYRSIYSLNQP